VLILNEKSQKAFLYRLKNWLVLLRGYKVQTVEICAIGKEKELINGAAIGQSIFKKEYSYICQAPVEVLINIIIDGMRGQYQFEKNKAITLIQSSF
jgi:hypothetical protein